MDYSSQLKEILGITLLEKASDLHISVGHPPVLRISSRLVPLIKRKPFTPEDTEGLAYALMTEDFLK